MPLHVLNDDNGVVDHQACSQRDAKQRKRVNEKPNSLRKAKVPMSDTGIVTAWNNGGAPVKQEEENDHDHNGNSFSEGDKHFADGVPTPSGIECDGILQPRRKSLLEFSLRAALTRVSTSRALALDNCHNADAGLRNAPGI